MKKNAVILKWSLFAGAVYFALVSSAHMAGVKIPGLFIYFNVPSYSYQDKIISFLALGWAVFFYTAFLNPIKNDHLLKAILISGSVAIAGLSLINITTNFHRFSENIQVSTFWLETICLLFYLVWLIFFYMKTIPAAKS